MTSYIIRRVLQAIPLLVGISILLFLLLQMTPGGPLALGENPSSAGRVTPEQLDRLRSRYGLDDPIYVQYLKWGQDMVRGDWGNSFNTGRPVLSMIGDRLPTTLMVMGLAFSLTLLVAIPLGLMSALKHQSRFDYSAGAFSFIGISMPSFWFAILLIYLFSYSLGWLPSVGLSDLRQDHTGVAMVVDRIRHLVLPVLVLGLGSTATVSRYVRAAMLEAISQDYVRTARAKGLKERVVVVRHALKNAAIPVITVLAMEIPDLFIGAVIVESIFAIPGMGRLFIESAELRDYPALMAVLLIASFLVISFNLLADIAYAIIDPRIKLA